MRAVCAVLGLDAAVEAEVAVLRRNLLRLAHTREFAPAAAFKARARPRTVAAFSCGTAASLQDSRAAPRSDAPHASLRWPLR